MRLIELAVQYFPSYMKAMLLTLESTVFALILATLIGILFSIFKLSKYRVLKGIVAVYLSMIRGTPLMVQILVIYFGLPMAMGFRWNLTLACVLIMSINAGAYMTELIRGGIESVDKGQMEAARSQGLSYVQAMWKVILPQAVRTMLPSIVNQMIVTLKDTSLLSVISFRELTQNTKIIVANNMEALTMYFICGLYYWIVVNLLTLVQNHIERRTQFGR